VVYAIIMRWSRLNYKIDENVFVYFNSMPFLYTFIKYKIDNELILVSVSTSTFYIDFHKTGSNIILSIIFLKFAGKNQVIIILWIYSIPIN